jgi:hypothetical protein
MSFPILLKSQNIDTSREKDKKEQESKNKGLEKVELSDVKQSDQLNLIRISDEDLSLSETIVTIKERKRYKHYKKSEQPPAQKFRVRLYIQNKNPHPMWYLMPYNGSNRLPVNGLFNSEPSLIEGKKMLSMLQYEGAIPETYLREMLFTGLPNQHFRAFYLPAGATLSLRNYSIDCWQDSETVEFWAVKELKANNSIELQNLLPYKTLSSLNIEVNCPLNQSCTSQLLTPDDKITVSDEPIRFIKADKVSKYLVRLNQPQ